jgi:hypothetical protein
MEEGIEGAGDAGERLGGHGGAGIRDHGQPVRVL